MTWSRLLTWIILGNALQGSCTESCWVQVEHKVSYSCDQQQPHLSKAPMDCQSLDEYNDSCWYYPDHFWGGWSPWSAVSDWGPCSVTCGAGIQTRQRVSYGTKWAPDYHCCFWKGIQETRQCERCYHGGTWSPEHGCVCKERMYGECCQYELGVCKTIATDIVFVLDSSVSQTEEQFAQQLDFVIQFINQVNISNEDFQVGVVTFSTDAITEIDINQNDTKEKLQNSVRDIKFRPGVTFTHLGLDIAHDILSNRGNRIKDGFPLPTMKYAMVITDGLSSNKKLTTAAAKQLKTVADKVIAIGIGQEVSHMELLDIASNPDSQSTAYVFSVEDFNSLHTIIKELVNITCERCQTSTLSDIVFLLDKGPNMTSVELQLAIDAVSYIIDNNENVGKTNETNMGLISFGLGLQTVIGLSEHKDQTQLKIALQGPDVTQQSCPALSTSSCDTMNITSAIRNSADKMFATENGGRDDARKFLITLSNGVFDDHKTVKSDIEAFIKETNVTLFVIGLGEDANMEGLLSLVDDPNKVFLTQTDNDFRILNILQSEFKYNVCNVTET